MLSILSGGEETAHPAHGVGRARVLLDKFEKRAAQLRRLLRKLLPDFYALFELGFQLLSKSMQGTRSNFRRNETASIEIFDRNASF